MQYNENSIILYRLVNRPILQICKTILIYRLVYCNLKTQINMLKPNWRVRKWCSRHLLCLENKNLKSLFSHNVTFVCYSRVEATGAGLSEQDIRVTDQNRFRNLWCSCFYLWKIIFLIITWLVYQTISPHSTVDCWLTI